MKATRLPSRTVFIWTVLTATCLFLVQCNPGTTPDSVQPGDSDQPAQITLTVQPNPITARPLTTGEQGQADGFQWKANFVLTIAETAGIGANIEAIDAQVDESSGGILVSTGNVLEEFTISSQTNRLDGNASVTVEIDVLYAVSDDKREALITIEIFAIDDNGFEYEDFIRVPVT